MKINNLIVSVLLLTSVMGCVTPDDYAVPAENCANLTATLPVVDVTSAATTTYQQYTNEGIMEAYVTSSDEGGNFYKSISFVSLDGAQGFSIPVDQYNLYTEFEPGRKVFVNMKDKYFVTDFNSTKIGSLYNGGTPADLTDDSVGRVSIVEYKNMLSKSCTKVNEDDLVNNLTINQAKNNNYINKLIEFDMVQFSDESLNQNFYDTDVFTIGGGTNHSLVDKDGNSIVLRVSEYANFATQAIPSGSGKVRGVLTKFGSTFQFMVRTILDVKLTEPRIVPLFLEPFTNNFPNWTKYSVTGAQVWSLDTQFGNPGSCAKMSGYAGSNNANEDWLISPAIDLSGVTSATLTFDTASRFAGNLLEAKISTNYTGGNPNAATWTNLVASLDTATGSYIWTPSGNIDISAFTGGNVFIAFKYTSTTSASRTWEVDNVKIDQ